MKHSIKGLVVILAIIMSLVAVQGVCAGEVTGSIESISTNQPYKIEVDGKEISGVRYNYLCNQYNICLEIGDIVTVEYYEFQCPNGTIKNMATSITVGDVTVTLRTVP